MAKTKAELPFTTDWIPSGTPLTYAYASAIPVTTFQQYAWSSTSGLSQTQQSNTFEVTAGGTIDATYLAEYKVQFIAEVLPLPEGGGPPLDDSAGTVVTVNDINLTASMLPYTTDWIPDGSIFRYSFVPWLTSASGAKYQYVRNMFASFPAREASMPLHTGGNVMALYLVYSTNVSVPSCQYSDNVTFTAEYPSGPPPGGTLPTTVHFYVGDQDVGSATLTNNGRMALVGTLNAPLLETGSGQMAAGPKVVTAKWDNLDSPTTPTTTLTVTKEDAAMAFASNDSNINPAAVKVSTDGGNSGMFTFEVHITQADDGWPGDIGLIDADDVSISLDPVGPGSPITQIGSSISTDPLGARIVTFNLNNIPVNTYGVTISLNNNYFTAEPVDSVLTVYDPSLGFTSGCGWFYWPNTDDPANGYPGDKTNFGYSMQYGKNGSNLKGGLILIRHMQNGDICRIKSNALDAGSLAIGTTDLPKGWATFSGKCNYTSIISVVATTTGNIPFNVYVEDQNEPGTLADRFWIQVNGYPDLCLTAPPADNGVTIDGGNIIVPHAASKKTK